MRIVYFTTAQSPQEENLTLFKLYILVQVFDPLNGYS